LSEPGKTRSSFDRQLELLKENTLRMGALVERSCVLSSQALFEQNLPAAQQITDQDETVNALYHQIEIDCITLIALQAPVCQDLRLLSGLLQIAKDLERIGDHAKDLGSIAMQLFPYPPSPCMPEVRLMCHRAQSMLAMSLSALANLDAIAGLEVNIRDELVDADYETLYRSLAQQRNIQGSIEPFMLLVLVLQHLERIADHATNIGRRVAYVVTGQS
jgi:phosphate transport system protein